MGDGLVAGEAERAEDAACGADDAFFSGSVQDGSGGSGMC
jgi:hypothetical protein